jgi:superfamily II DNA helicase RecQ
MDEVIDESAKALGLCALKSYQREAVTTFLSGQDVFVALPTGYGKSIIYGILPLVYDKLTGMLCYLSHVK